VVLNARYDRFNSIVIAFRDPADGRDARNRLAAGAGLPREPSLQLLALLRDVQPGGRPLTDDRAPIERLTDEALLEYLREGAPGAR
jgi:hypothetical protein